MKLSARMLACVAAGLAWMPGPGWAQADTLKHDPFTRPTLQKPPPAAQSRPDADVVKRPLPEPVWKPELDAVVVAGPKSMVSIDGTIVRMGEEINGHRLVEVHEQAAVFVKNRKRVTVSLRGTPPADATRRAERRDDRKAEEK